MEVANEAAGEVMPCDGPGTEGKGGAEEGTFVPHSGNWQRGEGDWKCPQARRGRQVLIAHHSQ